MKAILIITKNIEQRDSIAQECAKKDLESHLLSVTGSVREGQTGSICIVGKLNGVDHNSIYIRRKNYKNSIDISCDLNQIKLITQVELQNE